MKFSKNLGLPTGKTAQLILPTSPTKNTIVYCLYFGCFHVFILILDFTFVFYRAELKSSRKLRNDTQKTIHWKAPTSHNSFFELYFIFELLHFSLPILLLYTYTYFFRLYTYSTPYVMSKQYATRSVGRYYSSTTILVAFT